MGVGSSLIYAPATYAETPELAALVTEAGRCGGIYISHMRSEGNRVVEAVDELIDISRQSGAPAEIYHLKAAGEPNWSKLPAMIAHIDAARARGQPHHRRHVYVPGGRHGPRRRDAALGAGGRPGSLDRAAERPRHSRARDRRDALGRCRVRKPASLRGRGRDAAAQLQEPGAQAAHRQDAGRGRRHASRKPRRHRYRSGDRGRLARRRRLFPDVGRQCPPRGSASLCQLRLGRSRARTRGRVPQIEPTPARVRHVRAASRPLRHATKNLSRWPKPCGGSAPCRRRTFRCATAAC